LIETSYSAISEKFCELDDKQLKWEMIKMELRGLIIIQYAKRKARKSREYLESLEQWLAETDAFINNSNEEDGNTAGTVKKKSYSTCISTKRRVKAQCFTLSFSGRTGRETNKVFFQYGGKNSNQKTISELETSEGVKITDHKQLKTFIRIYTSQNMLVHMNSSQTLCPLCATS